MTTRTSKAKHTDGPGPSHGCPTCHRAGPLPTARKEIGRRESRRDRRRQTAGFPCLANWHARLRVPESGCGGAVELDSSRATCSGSVSSSAVSARPEPCAAAPMMIKPGWRRLLSGVRRGHVQVMHKSKCQMLNVSSQALCSQNRAAALNKSVYARSDILGVPARLPLIFESDTCGHDGTAQDPEIVGTQAGSLFISR